MIPRFPFPRVLRGVTLILALGWVCQPHLLEGQIRQPDSILTAEGYLTPPDTIA